MCAPRYWMCRMTQDIDIWRSAAVVVKHHGDEAPIHAAMRADDLLDAGNIEVSV